jgi:hypothetical protein
MRAMNRPSRRPVFSLVSTEIDPANMPTPFPWSPRRSRDRYSIGHISLGLALGLRSSALDAQAHGGEGNYHFTKRLNLLMGTSSNTLWSLRSAVEDVRTSSGFQTTILPPQVHSYNLGTNAAMTVVGQEYHSGTQVPNGEVMMAEVHYVFGVQDALHGLVSCAITSFGDNLPRRIGIQLAPPMPLAPLPQL